MNIGFLLLLFLLSCAVSYGILSGIRYLWTRWHLLDRPHLYKSEQGRPPAPYSAGVMIFLTLLVMSPMIVYFGDFSENLREKLMIILLVGGLLNAISFVDDMDTIGRSPVAVAPIFRLGMQILVGMIIGFTSIKIAYVSNLFGGILYLKDISWQWEFFGLTLNFFPMMVTIFWYVLIFNAVNFSDGVPGITGGFAFISFIILGILATKLYIMDTSILSQENSRFLLTILAVLVPATFFLTRFDISRRVIMGDTGTLTLAFFIATLSIIVGGKIATAISVMGVYIVDAIYVVMLRIKRGQNPMKWDQNTHLHFRLMEIGLSKNQVRAVVYFLTTIFGFSAIFLSSAGKIILFVIIAGVTIFLTEILTLVQSKNSHKNSKIFPK